MARISAIARRPTGTLGRDIPEGRLLGAGATDLTVRVRRQQRDSRLPAPRWYPTLMRPTQAVPTGLPTVRTDPGTCHLATTLSHGTKVAAGR